MCENQSKECEFSDHWKLKIKMLLLKNIKWDYAKKDKKIDWSFNKNVYQKSLQENESYTAI